MLGAFPEQSMTMISVIDEPDKCSLLVESSLGRDLGRVVVDVGGKCGKRFAVPAKLRPRALLHLIEERMISDRNQGYMN